MMDLSFERIAEALKQKDEHFNFVMSLFGFVKVVLNIGNMQELIIFRALLNKLPNKYLDRTLSLEVNKATYSFLAIKSERVLDIIFKDIDIRYEETSAISHKAVL